MRHSMLIGCWTRVLVLALAVGGCAHEDLDSPRVAAPNPLGEAWRAPIVLRPGGVAVDMQAPRRTGYTPGLAGEVFWLSVASLMTFGLPLIDLPNVVARHQTSVMDLPQECADSWLEVMKRPLWLEPAEERTSALEVLAEAMRLDLDRRGQELTIEIEPTPADDPRSVDALVSLGSRLSVPMLVVADVRFSIEAQPAKCAMLMQVSAQMHREQFGAQADASEAVSMTKASAVSVTKWAKDPEFGGRVLQGILGQLGQDIARALPSTPVQ